MHCIKVEALVEKPNQQTDEVESFVEKPNHQIKVNKFLFFANCVLIFVSAFQTGILYEKKQVEAEQLKREQTQLYKESLLSPLHKEILPLINENITQVVQEDAASTPEQQPQQAAGDPLLPSNTKTPAQSSKTHPTPKGNGAPIIDDHAIPANSTLARLTNGADVVAPSGSMLGPTNSSAYVSEDGFKFEFNEGLEAKRQKKAVEETAKTNTAIQANVDDVETTIKCHPRLTKKECQANTQ